MPDPGAKVMQFKMKQLRGGVAASEGGVKVGSSKVGDGASGSGGKLNGGVRNEGGLESVGKSISEVGRGLKTEGSYKGSRIDR